MSEAAVHGTHRISRILGGTALGAAFVVSATLGWAHPGHPIGDQLLGETLHTQLGVHWAVVEPILLLAAVVAAAKLAGWAVTRVMAWGRASRRAQG